MSENYLKYKLSYIIPYKEENNNELNNTSININDLNEISKLKDEIPVNNDLNERCKFCKKLFIKEKFEIHLKKCQLKFSLCKHCELSVAKNDLKDHEYNCGSRTDYCLDCLDVVRIRELEVHQKFLCKKRNK